MSVDPIAGLSLLSHLFESVASTFGRIKGSPKRRFGRDIFFLFEVLSEVEQQSAHVISDLEKSIKDKDPKERHEFCRHASYWLLEMQVTFTKFLFWLDKHNSFQKSLDMFAPDAFNLTISLTLLEEVMAAIPDRERYWNETLRITKSRRSRALPAFDLAVISLRSTAMKLTSDNLPSTARLRKIVAQMKNLSHEVRNLKTALRKFAISKLSIDDVF